MENVISIKSQISEKNKMTTTSEISIVNHYGEMMHVKLEDGNVYVHHEDATKDFINLNDLFTKVVLDIHEVVLIHASVKALLNGGMGHLNWTKAIIEEKNI
jgi:hypothetical protein